MLHFNLLTLFPEMFPGPLAQSVVGKALNKSWSYEAINIRDFTEDRHQTVDDTPFGGGAGMVMRPDIVDQAIRSIPESKRGQLIYLSPRGCPLTQDMVKKFSQLSNLSLLCGRYEGIDERIIDVWNPIEVSIGDFVLSGGETAALCLMDACVRLLPGVLGNRMSAVKESFEGFLLEHPHYTKPRVWNNISVPDVLLTGHHAQIHDWRQAQSKALTEKRRPDLWKDFLR